MANYASQNSSILVQANLNATLAVTGAAYTAPSVNDTVSKKVTYSTSQANAVASGNTTGSDESYSAITSIAGGGTATLDLTALTDLFGQALNFARVKGIVIQLLSATDDSTVVTGASTAASQITVGNAALNAFPLPLGALTHTIVLKNGEAFAWTSPTAAGVAVSATAKNLLITNNDGTNTAKVQITLVGGTT